MFKIAFITTMSGSSWGGSEYLWAATAEQALLDGDEVILSLHNCCANNPTVQKLQKYGANLLVRPDPDQFLCKLTSKVSKKIPLPSFLTPEIYFQQVLAYTPDLICINQGSTYDLLLKPELFPLLELLTTGSIPYFIICHFNSDHYLPTAQVQAAARKLFSKAASVAFVSMHNLRIAERQLAQVLPNAVIVKNPVNMEELDIVPFPSQPVPHFATVARLDPCYKGHDILLETLAMPIWQEREWQCNLYGAGPDLPYLESLARHYNVSERVKFAGHRNNIRSVWAENHLLVLPSRAEGTPLALIEAMLCGRSAVVTDVGGNTEWIEEGVTGFVAEASTAKSLSAALDRAWMAQTEWKQMGIQAHELVFSKFDRTPGKSLLELMRSLTKI